MSREAIQRFFAYARERERIRQLKESGAVPPWTRDPILQMYRFCNVFREDDRVTRWFAANIRDPMRHSQDVIFATAAFRFFNTIPAGQRMLAHHLFEDWNAPAVRRAMGDMRPIVTGAYMVKTPRGLPKLEGLIQLLTPVFNARSVLAKRLEQPGLRLEEACAIFEEIQWIGAFMAYEIVTDLRHTHFLENAPDIMSWANPGPGATRGIERVVGARVRRKEMLNVMRDILEQSRDPHLWTGRPWEMREVEHTLCEFDKYERARLGEGRPKQKYRPHKESSECM